MIALAWLLGCTGSPPTDTDPVPTSDTDGPTGDTAVISTAETGDPLVDLCATLPALPATFQTFQGFGGAEDFDLDFQGRHVSVASSGNLVARTPQGQQTLISANVSSSAACTRLLPSGDFVVCDVSGNSLVKVETATGAKSTLLTGLSYPNGAEVDPEGFVYVAEQSGGRLRRVDSETGDFTIIATGLDNPNGVIFSPDYQTLYVGSFGGGVVYALDRLGPDVFDTPRILAQTQGGQVGGFDGINVDQCGSVYITEFGPGRVWRITSDGGQIDLVADLPSGWIPNMRWGNGVAGWSETTLYVSDRGQGRLFGLEIGLRGKPSFTPPP
jgi:sugar lactone lactonase YvrE